MEKTEVLSLEEAVDWLEAHFEWFVENDHDVFFKVRSIRRELGKRYALFTDARALAKLVKLSALSPHESTNDAPSREALLWMLELAKTEGAEVLDLLESLGADSAIRDTGWHRDSILDAIMTVRAELANQSRWRYETAIFELYRDHGVASLARLEDLDLYMD